MKFNELKAWLLRRIEREWPRLWTYHSPGHVRDVYTAAKWYARQEGISEMEEKLVLTAALYHDSGFMIAPDNHEMRSCKLARAELPEFEYSHDEIEHICEMIMATRIPQNPLDRLAEILCDADLDYLGREDYFAISATLFEEFKMQGIVESEAEWLALQVRFLETHHYHTRTARLHRNETKKNVLEILRRQLNTRPLDP